MIRGRGISSDTIENDDLWTEVHSNDQGMNLQALDSPLASDISADVESILQYLNQDTRAFEVAPIDQTVPDDFLDDVPILNGVTGSIASPFNINEPLDYLDDDATNQPFEETPTAASEDSHFYEEACNIVIPSDWVEDDTNPPITVENSPAPTKRKLSEDMESGAEPSMPKKPSPNGVENSNVNFSVIPLIDNNKDISKRLYCPVLHKIYIKLLEEFELKLKWNQDAVVGKEMWVDILPVYIEEAYRHVTVKRCRNHKNPVEPERGVLEAVTKGAQYDARGAVRVRVLSSGAVVKYRPACRDSCRRYDDDDETDQSEKGKGKSGRLIKLVCSLVDNHNNVYGSCDIAYQTAEKPVRPWREDKKMLEKLQPQYITIMVPQNHARDMAERANLLCKGDLRREQNETNRAVLRQCMTHNRTQVEQLNQNVNNN